MIKKVLGIVIALLAIAVIVVAVMHRGKYASLVFEEPEAEAVFEATAEDGDSMPAAGAGFRPMRGRESSAATRSVSDGGSVADTVERSEVQPERGSGRTETTPDRVAPEPDSTLLPAAN